mmetsp:Transcript_28143/g.32249  ORF Transcript_28143/g.32249 Transcript_28143/m.32249 type:complete len:219 (-) Transcript_28143:16-672(-)
MKQGKELKQIIEKFDRRNDICDSSKVTAQEEAINQVEDNSDDTSIMIADWQGIIHAFNKHSPKLFQIDSKALHGKNFFQLLSSYCRKFLYETFGDNMFKTFKETSRTIRFSLPHMDDVDYEHFTVITSKVTLVKPKIASPLNTDPYKIRICSRLSSEESRLRLYDNYTKARESLRAVSGAPSAYERQPSVYIQEPALTNMAGGVSGTRLAVPQYHYLT